MDDIFICNIPLMTEFRAYRMAFIHQRTAGHQSIADQIDVIMALRWSGREI